MTKPYDLVDLEARLKAQGLPALEALGKIVVDQTFAWLSDSAAMAVAQGQTWQAILVPVESAVQASVDAALTPKA